MTDLNRLAKLNFDFETRYWRNRLDVLTSAQRESIRYETRDREVRAIRGWMDNQSQPQPSADCPVTHSTDYSDWE